MGSSRWDVVVGLKYSKWSLANQTSVVIEYDRSLARSRIDLVEAITRYTNKPINFLAP